MPPPAGGRSVRPHHLVPPLRFSEMCSLNDRPNVTYCNLEINVNHCQHTRAQPMSVVKLETIKNEPIDAILLLPVMVYS